MRLYVIGNDDCVLGFSLVGVDGRAVHNEEALDQALDAAMSDPTIGLLLVTRDVAMWQRERIDQMKVTGLTPLVVEIPGEGREQETASLHDLAQRAIGVRLGG